MSVTTTDTAPPSVPVETPQAPTPADAGVSVSADPYAAAREALVGKTWDQVVPADATPPSPSAPTEPAETPVEAPAAPDFTQWTVDAEGKLHRPDGTFAESAEIEAYNASVPRVSEAPAEPAPEPIVVTLKTRNGDEKEIEVTDPEIAELLRANHNDGMRRQEFTRRIAEVEAKEAEYREFETMLETNPEYLILQALPPEKQVSIATALLAQHWDAVVDRIAEYHTDPSTRVRTAAEAQIAIRDNQAQYQQQVAKARYIAEVRRTIDTLVPETVQPDIAERFLRDAESDLAAAVRARNGQPVPTSELAGILAPRLALYGFDKPQSAGAVPAVPAVPPKPPARPVARPVAKAGTPAAMPRPSVNTATAPGETVRKAVQAQAIAAAVPPAGAGAATLRVPLVPPNATIEEASAAMRKHRTWAEVT